MMQGRTPHPLDGTHKGVGHQRRRRVIDGTRIDEQEYPDGSVTVFVNFEPVQESFEEACARYPRPWASNRTLPLNAPHTLVGALTRLHRARRVFVGRLIQETIGRLRRNRVGSPRGRSAK